MTLNPLTQLQVEILIQFVEEFESRARLSAETLADVLRSTAREVDEAMVELVRRGHMEKLAGLYRITDRGVEVVRRASEPSK